MYDISGSAWDLKCTQTAPAPQMLYYDQSVLLGEHGGGGGGDHRSYSVNNGFTNNKHILHKASIFVHAHVDYNIKNLKSIHLRYI